MNYNVLFCERGLHVVVLCNVTHKTYGLCWRMWPDCHLFRFVSEVIKNCCTLGKITLLIQHMAWRPHQVYGESFIKYSSTGRKQIKQHQVSGWPFHNETLLEFTMSVDFTPLLTQVELVVFWWVLDWFCLALGLHHVPFRCIRVSPPRDGEKGESWGLWRKEACPATGWVSSHISQMWQKECLGGWMRLQCRQHSEGYGNQLKTRMSPA